jgi:hypothetical protein
VALIVLDTDVVSRYRAGRLPAGAERQLATNDISIAVAEHDGLVLLGA